MKFPLRQLLFLAGAIGMAILYALAFAQLPGPEGLRSMYRDVINLQAVEQRHITDAITAVNFDYRGFDTLGEEFILFVSVMGALVLLREEKDDGGQKVPDAAWPARSVPPGDALRVWTLSMTGPVVLFGIYIVVHGQLTPGGGFQGGVILATAPLLIYIAENLDVFKRITSHEWIEIAEAVGAGGYALIGLIAFFFSKPFLTNVIPLGPGGTNINLLSGGMVPLIDLTVGLEVAAGFVLLLYAFLQEMLVKQGDQ